MSINVMGRPQERKISLFRLFRVISGLFQPVLGGYSLFRAVLPFTSEDATEYFDVQIDYKSTSCRSYYSRRREKEESIIIKWDSFVISEKQLKDFMSELNQEHPYIKFDYKFDCKQIEFLDTLVYIDQQNKLQTSLF